MAFAHFNTIWAPGGPKMTSLLKKCLVTSNDLLLAGAMFESLKNPKYDKRKTALYTFPYIILSQACTSLVRVSIVKVALYLGKYFEFMLTDFTNK